MRRRLCSRCLLSTRTLFLSPLSLSLYAFAFVFVGGDSYALAVAAASSIFNAAFLWIIGIKCGGGGDGGDG